LLSFDFSRCETSIQSAIMALVSAEKVFRMYKRKNLSSQDNIRVDKKIDAFLKQCFNRYDYYCSSKEDAEDQNYCKYTFLQEDEQLDDITLLAVKRV
ncbi:MAG: histidine kinase, partial [Treponema sp.]|nr:histidine kinase [Treponema sp.]